MTVSFHGKLRILIADDDVGQREALGEYFVREGFAVQLAGSGLEAVELLRRLTFDLSVLDGHMPGLTGPEVLRRLNAIAGPAAIPPTVLVSSDTAIELWVREQIGAPAFATAALDFVPKPIRLEALRRSIEALLGGRPPRPRPQP